MAPNPSGTGNFEPHAPLPRRGLRRRPKCWLGLCCNLWARQTRLRSSRRQSLARSRQRFGCRDGLRTWHPIQVCRPSSLWHSRGRRPFQVLKDASSLYRFRLRGVDGGAGAEPAVLTPVRGNASPGPQASCVRSKPIQAGWLALLRAEPVRQREGPCRCGAERLRPVSWQQHPRRACRR